ncbi:MAG TPA: sulfite exporter TauE/SafE family protein [Xanthobacteraceae bacterium]|jgi:hypothetical protein|nr:sulfite exporter TauE/SafE family protein [Xanthobacteraceae bacterium]
MSVNITTETALGSAPRPAFIPASIGKEFLRQQLPILLSLITLGFAVAWFQYGYIPGGDRPFPIAGIQVPVWHIIWIGVWTGFTMALVGEASGIFALPYTISILRFVNAHVSPTMLVLTCINPIGALMGFRRSGQWNLNLAAAVCLGGVAGGLIGPFLRASVLSNAETFRFAIGLMLTFVALHLSYHAVVDYMRHGRVLGVDIAGKGGRPDKISIETVSFTFLSIKIRWGNETRQYSNVALFLTGLGVGIIASALGVGGGFLLVPIFAVFYRLPLYIMVAATIPFVITLSFTGLVTYSAILPLLGGTAITPEWSFGLFAASGGMFGAWCASKVQLYVPSHLLNLMLGSVTAVAGMYYVVRYLAPMFL